MFGLTLYQSIIVFLLGGILVACMVTAFSVSSKYFSVRYVPTAEAETEEFVSQVRKFVKIALAKEARERGIEDPSDDVFDKSDRVV